MEHTQVPAYPVERPASVTAGTTDTVDGPGARRVASTAAGTGEAT
ncbi:hypothetical protein AB0O34_23110 [Sphaerisporangium sp. NPDC088356]